MLRPGLVTVFTEQNIGNGQQWAISLMSAIKFDNLVPGYQIKQNKTSSLDFEIIL